VVGELPIIRRNKKGVDSLTTKQIRFEDYYLPTNRQQL